MHALEFKPASILISFIITSSASRLVRNSHSQVNHMELVVTMELSQVRSLDEKQDEEKSLVMEGRLDGG
jgi:hypothetical protein